MLHKNFHPSLFILLFVPLLLATAQASNCKSSLGLKNHSKHPRQAKHGHSRFTKHTKHTKAALYRHNSIHHKVANAKHRQTSASSSSKIPGRSKEATPNSYVSATGSNKIVSISSLTSACGPPDPVSSSTPSSGPNGSQDFLNCGITSGGWTPADVKMDMIKTVSLEDEPAKTTFAPCQKYSSLFEKYGAKYNVPPIFLASFAMQESSCNPDVRGDNGGAFGLMQITADKCGGAPGGNCADPDYNVDMGAKTFADGLSSTGGNVLLALGAYNGWTKGLTKSQAMAAKDTGCCVCQQNLDYLQQFLNGWILGIDPISKKLGMMRNLDACGSSY